uniref:Uncharacterized protein n=1 Tax=Romanomermis culicivorax TaxID=13658 RepID=A0A915JH12_ROMCU
MVIVAVTSSYRNFHQKNIFLLSSRYFMDGLSNIAHKDFLGGAGAVPPLTNVGVGVTILTRAQQKWSGSEPVDWPKHQCYEWNVRRWVQLDHFGARFLLVRLVHKIPAPRAVTYIWDLEASGYNMQLFVSRNK